MAISEPFPTLVSLARAETSRKMITKTVIKIEIRAEFMKIRGDLMNKSVEMQVQSHLLRSYGRMIPDHRQKVYQKS